MTVLMARKVLGALVKDLSDKQIEREIELSELLADLVIHVYTNKKGIYNGRRNA